MEQTHVAFAAPPPESLTHADCVLDNMVVLGPYVLVCYVAIDKHNSVPTPGTHMRASGLGSECSLPEKGSPVFHFELETWLYTWRGQK